MEQATKYEITSTFIDEENRIETPTMISHQDYATQSQNGVIFLDVPISSILRGVNPPAEKSLVWGVGTWATSYFLPHRSIVGGMSDEYSALESELGSNDFKLSNPIKLKIQGEIYRNRRYLFDNFTIYFDKGWGVYATRIKVDGVEFTDNNPRFTFLGETRKESYDIEITHVNKAGYPLIILGIYSGLSKTFDRWNGLLSFSVSNRNSFNTQSIGEWGIVTQQGRATIKDIDNEIQQLQEMGVLQNEQSLVVRMSYIDPISGEETWKDVGTYFSRFDYTFGTDEVPISMNGKVEKWQDVLYPGFPLERTMNAYNLLITLLEFAKVLDITHIESRAEDFLQEIVIEYCILSSSTLYEAINKVLYIAMCILREDENGEIHIELYDGTRYIGNVSEVYRINKSSTYDNSQGNYSDVIKRIEWNNKKVNDIVEFNTNVYNDKITNMEVVQTEDFKIGRASREVVDGSQTYTVFALSFAKMEAYYYPFSMSIPKKQNMNLEEVLELFNGVDRNGNPYNNAIITCERKTGSAMASGESYGTISFPQNVEEKWNPYTESATLNYNKDLTFLHRHTVPLLGYVDATANLENTTNFENFDVDEDDENYYVTINILVGFKTIGMGGHALSTSIDVSGPIELYEPKQLEISFMGNKRVISFEDEPKQFSKTEITTPKTQILSLNDNELMHNTTTLDGIMIGEFIAEKIVEYENGKQTLELKVQKNDYYIYDRNGNKTNKKISAKNGETFEVGDFIELWDDRSNVPFIRNKENKSKVFEVREVIKEKTGNPLMITLRLREV